MSYQINKFDGTELTILQDGTIDNSTSLILVGRNTTGYGEAQNENFIYLLENFSNDAPPSVPLSGQLWFNNVDNTVNVYDGSQWVEAGAATIADTAPENPPKGSFWLRSTDNILHVYNGSEWSFVGPDAVEDFGITRSVSRQIFGEDGREYPVILHTIDDTVIAIESVNNFNVNQTANPIPGFDSISPGITLLAERPIFGNLKGTATRAEILDKTRTINGIGFNGSRDITITAATPNALRAGDYINGNDFTGSETVEWRIDAQSSNVIGSVVARDSQGNFSANIITADIEGNLQGEVTSTGTSTFGTVQADRFIGQSLSGNAATATKLRSFRQINGVNFDGTEDITVPANAKTLTNTELAPNVIHSQLQRVGTLENLRVADNGIAIGASGQLSLTNSTAPTINATGSLTVNLGTDEYLKFIPASQSLALSGDNTNTIYGAGINLGHTQNKFDKIYSNDFIGNLSGNATTSTASTTATNLAGGAPGALPYQTASGTTTFLASGAPSKYLRLNGSGIPVWDDINASALKFGDFLLGDDYTGLSEVTINVDATSANTAEKIVARDASGNFSAGTITASLNGIATQASTVYVDESEDDNRNYNIVFLDSTAGGNGYRQLQVDNTALVFNPGTNTLGNNLVVDGRSTLNINRTGDTMTGFLTLNSNPTTNMHAATKQYVDTTVEDKIEELGPGQVRAFVRFDGSDLTVKHSLRVISVDRISAGRYRINFEPGAFTDANYVMSGMASDTDHFVAFRSGDISQAQIFTVDNGSGNNTPSTTGGDVMVTFFV